MSSIKIRNEKESEKDWESLEHEMKDDSLWKDATAAIQSEFEKVKDSLVKKRGRPKNEEETQGVFIKLPLDEAKESHIGYQSLIKMILSKHVRDEKEKKSA
jgi:hypothetical protein